MACEVCSRLKKRCRYSKGGKGKRPLKENSVESTGQGGKTTSKGKTTAKVAKSQHNEAQSSARPRRLRPIVELPPVRPRGKPKVVLDDSTEASDSSPPRKKARIETTPPQASTSKRPIVPNKSLRRLRKRSSKSTGTPPVDERIATPNPPSSPPSSPRRSSPPPPARKSPSPPPEHTSFPSPRTHATPLPYSPSSSRVPSPTVARTGKTNPPKHSEIIF